jgi:hypothetical protein
MSNAVQIESGSQAISSAASTPGPPLSTSIRPAITQTTQAVTRIEALCRLLGTRGDGFALPRSRYSAFHVYPFRRCGVGVSGRGALWRYPPALFAEHGIVDRLSLYLSLKDDHDERTETALEEMMEKFNW